MASSASSDPQAASPIREGHRRRIYRSRGWPGSKRTALAQIEDGRTMGSTDPELPRPGSRRRANCNFARTILDRLGQQGSDRRRREDRGEANAGDEIEMPNTAAGPSRSSESPAQPVRFADGPLPHTHPEGRFDPFAKPSRMMGWTAPRTASACQDGRCRTPSEGKPSMGKSITNNVLF